MSHCCNPKKEICWVTDIHKAVVHAEERGKKTGKTQNMIYDSAKKAWRISTK